MTSLAGDVKNKRVADLGSGDGRISIEFGKLGALVTGYELNSDLVLKSQESIKELGLEAQIKIHYEDFWKADLSVFDIITVYPMPDVMLNLEQKLQKEIKKGAIVLTNYYPFPNWIHWEVKDKIYKYIK